MQAPTSSSERQSKQVIIGTAGHVDHGKTSLVRALTGVETDRLPEEKRREMTIDLGFANFSLPSGRRASIVDVPGHERFVGNMLAGATGIDLVLFVVAADEGAMPQTFEHLDILDLLGLEVGIIVLTKTDLVEPDWLEMVQEEVREATAGTFLAAAPIVPVSSRTGHGLDELVRRCDEALDRVSGKAAYGPARLPVDRVFTVAGFGTVVTGTLLSGRVAVEDRLELLPAGREVRVRSLQVHGEDRPLALAGQRIAVNLAGLERSEVARGEVLASPGAFSPGDRFDGELRLVGRAPRALRSRSRVHLHTGTSEVIGRLLLLDRLLLEPGESALVQFHSEAPLVLGARDRFIIRSYSPVRTIGGGVVVDPHPPWRRRRLRGSRGAQALESLRARQRGDPAEALTRVLQGAGGPLPRIALLQQAQLDSNLPPDDLEAAFAELLRRGSLRELDDAGQVMLSDLWEQTAEAALGWLARYHGEWPLRRGAGRDELRAALLPGWAPRRFATYLHSLAAAGRVELQEDRVAAAGHRPVLEGDLAELARWVQERFVEGGSSPPDRGELAREIAQAPQKLPSRGRPGGAVNAQLLFDQVFDYLLETAALVKVKDDIVFHRDVLARISEHLVRFLEERGSVTVSDFRQLIGTSRKYAVPLLEYFDARRVTRREGDVRFPGPGAGSPGAGSPGARVSGP
ncbi:MAG: selenocysteine-specific translation elongation factor [Bacillota bacterium]|nr:selenocysteine-specific translation elongation factor [Bacillota bacterium]